MLSTLLYGNDAWTLCTHQERRLNIFHLPSLRRILGIKCRNHISDTSVLEFAGIPSMFSLLNESHLCWLGHVRRMDAEWIPKDILFGELATGSSGASIQLPEKHWPQIEASGEQLSRLPQAWRGAGERAVEGKEKRSHHNSDLVSVFTRSTCNRAWGSRICMCSHSGFWNLKRGLSIKFWRYVSDTV